MAHEAQQAYCESVKARFPQHFTGKRVLDIGSRSINGSCLELFDGCAYIGIDVSMGDNVHICDPRGAHMWMAEMPAGRYDTIISCECFEHDKYLADTLKAIARSLAPGGMFLFTAAGPTRNVHGTSYAHPYDCPDMPWGDHYEAVTQDRVRNAIDLDAIFAEHGFQEQGADIYFYGIKR